MLGIQILRLYFDNRVVIANGAGSDQTLRLFYAERRLHKFSDMNAQRLSFIQLGHNFFSPIVAVIKPLSFGLFRPRSCTY